MLFGQTFDRCPSGMLLSFVFLLVLIPFRLCDNDSSGLYADNGIDQTLIVGPLPQKDRKDLQDGILRLLELHSRPRSANQIADLSAPLYMKKLYQYIDKDSGDIKVDELRQHNESLTETDATLNLMSDADVIMSFVNQARKQHHHLRRDSDRRFVFDLSEVPVDHMVTGAKLRLFKEYSWKQPWFQNFTIKVHLIKRGKDLEDRELELLDEALTYTIFKGWIDFNVSRAIEYWMESPKSNFGLLIGIQSGTGETLSPDDISLTGKDGAESKQGFMVAFFKQSLVDSCQLISRKKRSPDRPAEKKRRKPESSSRSDLEYRQSHNRQWFPFAGYDTGFTSRTCQKRTLYVSFRTLGWQDWIIAPDGYAAYYCHGECSFPLNAHMNATNHAIVQTLVHLYNPSLVGKASCAPTKLSAISVLYFDDNSNVVLKKYRNMVVRGCGCH